MSLFFINFIYERVFFEQDIQRYSPHLNMLRNMDPSSSILYLQSSTNTITEPLPEDQSVSELLRNYYPSIQIENISIHGAHTGIFKDLIRHVPAESKLNTLIVELNMRSLGYEWVYSYRESDLQKGNLLLKPFPPLINRFLLTFQAYFKMPDKKRNQKIKDRWKKETFDTLHGFDYPNVFEWDRGLAMEGVRNDDGSYSHQQTALGCHYIKSFAVDLDTINHPRVKDLEKIIEMSKNQGWHVVINILPVNLEEMDELVGPELVQLVKENRDKIMSRFNRKDVLIIDNLELLESRFFKGTDQPSEDYNREGQNKLAFNMAGKLELIHKGKLNRDYQWTTTAKPVVFFNNCDEVNTWGKNNTITDERFFSFPRSSRVFASQPYSITLETSWDTFSLQDKNSIKIDLVASYDTDVSSAWPKLVVDITDHSGVQHWHAYELSAGKDTRKEGWKRYSYSHAMNALDYSPATIKVYVLNENEIPAYIDDFRIEVK
jgi:hypothetical protein